MEEIVLPTNKAALKFHETWGGCSMKVMCEGQFTYSYYYGYGSYAAYRKYNEEHPSIKKFKVTKRDDTGFTYDRSIVGKRKPPVYFTYNGTMYCETYLDGIHDVLGSIVAVEEWEVSGMVQSDDSVTILDDVDFLDDKEPPSAPAKLEEKTIHVFVAMNAAGDCLCIASYEDPPDNVTTIEGLDDEDFVNEIETEEVKAIFSIEDIMDTTADPFGDF